MNDFRADPADRFLTWQDAAVRNEPRRLGVAPFVAAIGALALAMGLAMAPQAPTQVAQIGVKQSPSG